MKSHILTRYKSLLVTDWQHNYRTQSSIWTKIALIALVTTAGNPLDAQSPIDAGTVYKNASPAVVTIQGLAGDGKTVVTGSGMLVSADGRLLTNYHVVAHVKQATVRLANGDAYDQLDVIAVDRRKDIAFLKIPAVDMPVVKLGRSNAVEIGQTIYSIGSPLGLQNTLSEGLISAIREMDGYRLFQISAPISHGNSGGPVFNRAGEVVGIAVMTIEGGQNLNFAIPIDYARGMLGMTQTQPLASIYEPEEPPAKAEAKPAPTAGTTAPVTVPDEMRKGSFAFLEKQIGHWTLDDARNAMGQPFRQRDSLDANKNVDGVIYAFPDPTSAMREFELNFSKIGPLQAVYAYPPPGSMHVKDVQQIWGRNYREVRNANGTRSYVYNDRRLNVIFDPSGAVYNLGVY
ncbi:MAG TPA: S1C family serine protease [Bryobacteraceae bacterium]|nr:S1C family serine protease [Bryobacteraceae bacterium]